MGLIASVYRNADRHTDCTLNGWSSRVTQVIITNAEGPFTPESYTDYMPVRIIKHMTMHCVHCVSEYDLASGKWTMFGGNFIYTSDSRFGELIAKILGPAHRYGHGPVSIHDRIEG